MGCCQTENTSSHLTRHSIGCNDACSHQIDTYELATGLYTTYEATSKYVLPGTYLQADMT